MENLMNVQFEKVLSAQVKINGNDGTYKVSANVTINGEKEITNADGQVFNVSDEFQVANFNKYGGNSLNVNYQVDTTQERCAIVTAIDKCLDKVKESAKTEFLSL